MYGQVLFRPCRISAQEMFFMIEE